jgi:hypothetical protein
MAGRRRQPIRLALVAAIALGYGWWVTGLPAFSTSATIAVVGAGSLVAAVSFARSSPSTADEPLDRSSWVIWSGLIAALAGWQLAAWAQEPRSEHPTLSSMANAMLEPGPIRAVAFVLWLAGAAWLGRR